MKIKRKIICIMLTVAIMFAAVSALSACGEKTYTVSFDLNYENATGAPAVQQIAEGKTAEKPDDPQRNGYIFDGWFTDKECYNEFAFTAKITKDTTVYAAWLQGEIEYTITFDLGYTGANGTPATQKLGADEKVEKPIDPTRNGFTFGGWFTDSAYTTIFDFNNVVTANYTLYAKWIEGGTVSVKFDYNYAGAPAAYVQPVAVGGKAAKPTDPTRNKNISHVFNAWYTDKAFTTEYDFDSAATADITLYANWTAVLEAEYTDLTGIKGVEFSSNFENMQLIVPDVGGELNASNGNYVTYTYLENTTLTFNFVSDKKADGVSLKLRITSELNWDINSDTYIVKVNGTPVTYAGDVMNDALDPFYDLTVSTAISLREGSNKIELVTKYKLPENKGLITHASPLLDCIKLTGAADITWTPKTANLDVI